jgi:cobalt-zinc-cadmium efflux system outer membrane protein
MPRGGGPAARPAKSGRTGKVNFLGRPAGLVVLVLLAGSSRALATGQPADLPPPARLGSPVSSPPAAPAYLPSADGPFAGLAELTAEAVVQQVLGRNPSLAQMMAAWQAAQARYPQATSLEDPMFAGTLGPATYGSNTVNPAYRLEISQKYPYPGKLQLRGQGAAAEAGAAGNEVEDMRLQLVEAARATFYDYYLSERALEVNALSIQLLQKAERDAQRRYETGKVDQQDMLLARVEIGRQRERRLGLEAARQIAVARLNTLMHLPPDAPLPPPPRQVAAAAALPEAAPLRAAALARRPDLLALQNRITAEEASLALARKEFYPDFEPFFMYDRFMGNTSDSRPLAYMLGLRMNLPVRLARRQAAVTEAMARLAMRRAELARQVDQVNFQVQQAYEQARQGERAVRLYVEKILPDAELNARAARSAYETGKITATTRVEAERNLVGLQERYYEAVAEYFRRLATLERVLGGPLAPPTSSP